MADLEEYRAKRRKGKTPEPLADEAGRPSPEQLVFVVQRHSARALHYDLRLERDGVLLSGALPRGVPLRAGERSLAVHVEDHPLDYADFEGEIPRGEYGGGSGGGGGRGTRGGSTAAARWRCGIEAPTSSSASGPTAR